MPLYVIEYVVYPAGDGTAECVAVIHVNAPDEKSNDYPRWVRKYRYQKIGEIEKVVPVCAHDQGFSVAALRTHKVSAPSRVGWIENRY